MNVADPGLYTDISGLSSLKAKARKDPKGAIEDVARQFEALYLQMMLKEMRKAGMGEGLFDSEQSKFYRELYDQQLALDLTKEGGIGLTDVLTRQLGGQINANADPNSITQAMTMSPKDKAGSGIRGALQFMPLPVANMKVAPFPSVTPVKAAADKVEPFKGPEDFVRRLRPYAEEAAAKLGISADALLAQAALESGWGKRQITANGGRSSNNLFGIKADRQWQGDRVSVSTLEYEGGVAVRRKEPFRSYNDYRQSFQDYVDFITSNPRYQKALQVTDNPKAYFRELQAAGYATDPDYAKKLAAILDSEPMRTMSRS